jgi:hypothetical protein
MSVVTCLRSFWVVEAVQYLQSLRVAGIMLPTAT